MARIRSIKPEFFTDEKIADLSPTARYLFIGMWCFCDDQGIHQASAKQIKMEIFPADDLSLDAITSLLNELLDLHLLEEYEVEGKRWWIVKGWKHQKIEKPNKKHPYPEPSQMIRRQVGDKTPEEGRGGEGRGEEKKDFDHRLRDDRPDLELLAGLDVRPPAEDEFSAVWQQWPRKVAKAAALKAWLKARKAVDFKTILAGLEQFVLAYDADPRPESEKQQFCPHFASWLNAERWHDYEVQPAVDKSALSHAERTRQVLLDAGLTPMP